MSDFYLRFFSSEEPTFTSDSHPKIFSSFISTSWTYLNLKFDPPLHNAAGRVIIHDFHRSRVLRAPICDFFRDCPFKGLRSLPKFLDLIPRCQIASCSGKI